MTATGVEPATTEFVNEHSGMQPKWPRAATIKKKIPWHRCFPAKFAKFLRTPFLQSTFERPLIDDTTKRKEATINAFGNYVFVMIISV